MVPRNTAPKAGIFTESIADVVATVQIVDEPWFDVEGEQTSQQVGDGAVQKKEAVSSYIVRRPPENTENEKTVEEDSKILPDRFEYPVELEKSSHCNEQKSNLRIMSREFYVAPERN